ncbi:hypothetical protein AAMO2058_000008000 [Amorphochlora amoebiformis]
MWNWTTAVIIRSVVSSPLLVLSYLQLFSKVPRLRRCAHASVAVMFTLAYLWDVLGHVHILYTITGWRTFLIIGSLWQIVNWCTLLMLLYSLVSISFASENLTNRLPISFSRSLIATGTLSTSLLLSAMVLTLVTNELKYSSIRHIVSFFGVSMGVILLTILHRKLYDLIASTQDHVQPSMSSFANLAAKIPRSGSNNTIRSGNILPLTYPSPLGGKPREIQGQEHKNASLVDKPREIQGQEHKNTRRKHKTSLRGFRRASRRTNLLSKNKRLLMLQKKLRIYYFVFPPLMLLASAILLSLAYQQAISTERYSDVNDEDMDEYVLRDDAIFWFMYAWICWLMYQLWNPLPDWITSPFKPLVQCVSRACPCFQARQSKENQLSPV